MYTNTLRGLEHPVTTAAESPANCPTCETPIGGVDAYAPDDHRLAPCGCAATFRLQSTTESDTQLVTDGGTQWADLSGFQRDLLFEIYRMDTDEPHGLGIKCAVSETTGQRVNHGRLYPNLDSLVDAGLVEKGETDRRTNAYTLTPAGRRLVETRARLFAAATPAEDTLTADGGVDATDQR